jgi:ferredoxin--NADP+ reductase
MPYVITDACIKDGLCEPVCPEESISSGTIEIDGKVYDQYFIDPSTCLDCGSCEAECPSGAIYAEDDLPANLKQFKGINAAFHKQ